MKRAARLLLILLCCVALSAGVAFAHSGDTDRYGGHYNHSTGEYHYHHGYPEHQHKNGICPYEETLLEKIIVIIGAGVTVAIPVYMFCNFIKKFFDGIRKNREIKRREEQKKAELFSIYNLRKMSDFVEMPRGVYIGENNLPTTDVTGKTYGIFIRFCSPYSQTKYHVSNCRYAPKESKAKIHAYEAQRYHYPCKLCRPVIFDFSWYDKYLEILELQKKYGFTIANDLTLSEQLKTIMQRPCLTHWLRERDIIERTQDLIKEDQDDIIVLPLEVSRPKSSLNKKAPETSLPSYTLERYNNAKQTSLLEDD